MSMTFTLYTVNSNTHTTIHLLMCSSDKDAIAARFIVVSLCRINILQLEAINITLSEVKSSCFSLAEVTNSYSCETTHNVKLTTGRSMNNDISCSW